MTVKDFGAEIKCQYWWKEWYRGNQNLLKGYFNGKIWWLIVALNVLKDLGMQTIFFYLQWNPAIHMPC